MSLTLKILLIGLVVTIVAGAIYFGFFANKASNSLPNTDSDSTTNNNSMPGSDKDEHGCIASAGYTWCEIKNQCLRSWEEPCQ